MNTTAFTNSMVPIFSSSKRHVEEALVGTHPCFGGTRARLLLLFLRESHDEASAYRTLRDFLPDRNLMKIMKYNEKHEIVVVLRARNTLNQRLAERLKTDRRCHIRAYASALQIGA